MLPLVAIVLLIVIAVVLLIGTAYTKAPLFTHAPGGSNYTQDWRAGELIIPRTSWKADSANGYAAGTYGTAGQYELDTMDYDNATADDLGYTTFVVPSDYYADLKLEVYFIINVGDNTKKVRWDGAAKVSAQAAVLDEALTGLTGVTVTCEDVAYETLKATLDLSTIVLRSDIGKNCKLQLFRDQDHADDDAAAVAKVYFTRLIYTKG